MISDQEALITKGRRSLAASRRLYEGGDYDFAASRAYYAMFYLVQALLLSRDLTFSKHSAVIAAFGQHFVKTGLFTAEHYSALRTAFDERNLSDYQYTVPFPRQAAGDLLDRAESFVKDLEAFLKTGGGTAS